MSDWFGIHKHSSMTVSASWALGQNLFRAVFQIFSAVVLSRLIAPEQFGVFAVMMVLHGLITPLIGNAFSEALIQKPDLTNQEASNFFWVAVAGAVICAIGFAAAGPAIAAFFGDPIYGNLALVFAALMWMDTVGAQYQAIVMRSLRFDVLFRIQLVTMPLALLAGVLAALSGLGTWALVIHMAVSSGVLRILLVRATGWRPQRYRRVAGLGVMVRFGAMTSLGAITRLAYVRLPMLFLAKTAGPAAVGFFNRGDALFKRPFEQAVHPIASLLLPATSAVAHDHSRLQLLIAQAIWLITLAMGPLIAAMAVFGDWVAVVLLGTAWAEAGEVVRWMAVMALGTAFRKPLAAVNAALGHPARSVGLKLVLLPAFLGLMLWAAPQGAAIAAAAMAAFYICMLPLEMIVLLRPLPLRRRAILGTCAAALTVTAALGAAMMALRAALPDLVNPTAPRITDLLDLTLLFLGAYVLVLPLAALFAEARGLLRGVAVKLWTYKKGRGSHPIPSNAADGTPT